jgi:hypothetical protein
LAEAAADLEIDAASTPLDERAQLRTCTDPIVASPFVRRTMATTLVRAPQKVRVPGRVRRGTRRTPPK